MLQFHVAISLVGIISGLVMLYGLLLGKNFTTAIAVFLVTTILTSLTGFPLPPFGFDPPRAVGVLSLILLAGAVAAYYGFRLAGAWRWIFVACAVAALYLNVFVLVAQGFTKVPALHELAPTQSEPPFAIAQGIAAAHFHCAWGYGPRSSFARPARRPGNAALGWRRSQTLRTSLPPDARTC